jgi:hypothetical protein
VVRDASLDKLETTARLYEEAAAELERALGHCRVAAGHVRQREVPRGAAHAWAARGHLFRAESLLDEQAREHAASSSLPED